METRRLDLLGPSAGFSGWVPDEVVGMLTLGSAVSRAAGVPLCCPLILGVMMRRLLGL